MSGGAYDYASYHIELIANELKHNKIQERKDFIELLKLVAIAVHDVEWVDSGDYGEGDELKSINNCFTFCVNRMMKKDIV